MRVELPSGGWVEVRDRLMSADRFAVHDAVDFVIAEGQQQRVSAGMLNQMRNALLTTTVTAWSFEGFMLPSQARELNGDAYDAAAFLGGILDLDDYNELARAVEPLMQKVSLAAVPN